MFIEFELRLNWSEFRNRRFEKFIYQALKKIDHVRIKKISYHLPYIFRKNVLTPELKCDI